MERDLIDGLLARWSEALPDEAVAELGVTGRLSRLGQHMADRDDATFGRYGRDARRGRHALARCASRGRSTACRRPGSVAA